MAESHSSGGTSILGLLGVAFIILKLCGVINWSWWWVTAPFWGGLALVLAICAVLGAGWLVVAAFKPITALRRRKKFEAARKRYLNGR